MSKEKATFMFYEKTSAGTFDYSEPCVYEVEGETMEDIFNNDDVYWKAIEIEGFDNSEVLVMVDFEWDKFIMTSKIVRTDEPSDYIEWGDKKLHIFKIDREKSEIHFEIL